MTVPSETRRSTRRLWPLAALLIWGGLIFGTSCTVILPHDFFQWMARYVLPGESAYQGFVVFWGVSWFTIVKGWHAMEFAILFCLIRFAIDRLSPQRLYVNVGMAVACAVLFAISDEYHQTFVPGRGGTFTDVCFDSLGVLIASLLRIRQLQRLERLNDTNGS